MVLIPLLQQSTTYQRNVYHDLRAVQRVTGGPTQGIYYTYYILENTPTRHLFWNNLRNLRNV